MNTGAPKSSREVRFLVRFPLTSAHISQSSASITEWFVLPGAGRPFSLSMRERAGVRGNGGFVFGHAQKSGCPA
jgi:hypothetical protein